MTNHPYYSRLKEMAKAIFGDDHGWNKLVDFVLENKEFQICSGSGNKKHHHYGDGGLIKHTYEVAALCLQNATFFFELDRLEGKKKLGVNTKVLLMAALYHDFGKIYDYIWVKGGDWVGTAHKRNIHHVSRSAIVWEKQASGFVLPKGFVDEVTHCILAHHGNREHGSPVAPDSREAWLLHLCDSMSARMDDCGRIDILEKYKNA